MTIDNDDILTVGDLISILQTFNHNTKVVVNAGDKVYAVLDVTEFEKDTVVPYDSVEILCWSKFYEDQKVLQP